MKADNVNEVPENIYYYQDFDLSQEKNEKKVINSILDLAKTAKADFNEKQVSDNKIDDNERMEITFYWLPIIGNVVNKIPAQFREACSDAIKKLKQVMIDIAKGMNAANLKDDRTGLEVNIDKEGNGTVVFADEKEQNVKNETSQTSSVNEPQKTDAESEKYDSPQCQIIQYRAEQRLKKLAQEKSSIIKEQNWYVNHNKPYYDIQPEDVGRTAMLDIVDIFLGKSEPKKEDAKHLLYWATDMFYKGKITGDEKIILVQCANDVLEKRNSGG